MKKLMMVFAIFNAVFFTAQAQTADETAIKTVIETETQAWHEGNTQKQVSCWSVQSYSKSLISLENGQLIHITEADAKNAPPQTQGDGGSSSHNNYQIKVNGNMAYVNFDEVTTAKDGAKRYSREMRVLEKINGAWKIVAVSAHFYKP